MNDINNPKNLKYRGVIYCKGFWVARIKHKQQQIYLGLFYKLSEAINAYDIKAIELLGKDAITNRMLIKIGEKPPITDRFDKSLPDVTDLLEEEWKDIEGWEKLYQVSNKGRIKSLPKPYVPYPTILAPLKEKKGYLYVKLCNANKQLSCKAHRLVAKAFIPNPDNLPQVNHKDLNKENNCVENLEWVTNQRNMCHAMENKVYTDRPLLPQEVVEIRKLKKSGKSQSEIARIFNIHSGRVSGIVRGITYKYIT